MPRLAVTLWIVLSLSACAAPPTDVGNTSQNDVGKTTSENVGDAHGTAATWGPILSVPR